jgi:hypothetical protein
MAGLALAAVFAVAAVLRAHWRRRRAIDAAAGLWQHTDAAQRCAVLASRCAGAPECAALWYLLGCAHLRQGAVGSAAQAFGRAYHADWRLASAALMTFACLKASADETGPTTLLRHVVTTWDEMGRPPLARRADERRLLDVLGSSSDPGTPAGAEAVARRIMALSGPGA